jgi:N,N'-diacetyllegionaminate synthase
MKRPSTYIIAEIGVNHAGDIDLAKKMVTSAKESGADAVKFQTFTADRLVGLDVPKVAYQERTTDPKESHYDMIKRLEFSREGHQALFDYCQEIGIDFLSTPYDPESVKFLDELGVKLFKVASADIVDDDLNEEIAKTGKPVIISTGMATLGEIEHCLKIYKNHNHDQITLLHCVSNYPCQLESLNMHTLKTLAQSFGFPIGYSDHAPGSTAAVAAVALGAQVIEKHFTLDKSSEGPDHEASSDPEDLKVLVKAIRDTEKLLGQGIKECQDEERQMATVSRKSLTYNRNLKTGDILKKDDLIFKRPGTGLSGKHRSLLVGKTLRHDVKANHLVSMGDIDFE